MSEDDQWKPLSFEEERFNTYPDQYHIFENYGKPNEDELPEALLTRADFEINNIIIKNIKGANEMKIKLNENKNINCFSTNPNKQSGSNDEESDDEIKRIKEFERDHLEQIRSMRSIGLYPNTRDYFSSNKLLPSNVKTEETIKGDNSIILESDSDSTSNDLSTQLSNMSVSSAGTSSSSNNKNIEKPRTIYDILKIQKTRPEDMPSTSYYNEEFPILNNKVKKKLKSKSKY